MLCVFSINCQNRAAEVNEQSKANSNNESATSKTETKISSDAQSNQAKVEAADSTAIQDQKSNDELKIPAEVNPFIEEGTKAIALESADLNGDKLKDYVLVLEKLNPEKDEYDRPVNQRPLIILIRDNQDKLSAVKRSEKTVMCSECGGMMGDAFEGVDVGEKTFTVNHYGGSRIRWAERYKFNYSRIDNTWQLVEVKKITYDSTEDDKKFKTDILTPKKFGKIDIADFDPEKLEDTN